MYLSRFFPLEELIPFFPPIELSTCENKVVGISLKSIPLIIVLAIKPDKSPIVPPPIATSLDFLSIFNDINLLLIFIIFNIFNIFT